MKELTLTGATLLGNVTATTTGTSTSSASTCTTSTTGTNSDVTSTSTSTSASTTLHNHNNHHSNHHHHHTHHKHDKSCCDEHASTNQQQQQQVPIQSINYCKAAKDIVQQQYNHLYNTFVKNTLPVVSTHTPSSLTSTGVISNEQLILIKNQFNNDMYTIITNIIKMGQYELFIELITSWNELLVSLETKDNPDTSSDTSTIMVNTIIHQYDTVIASTNSNTSGLEESSTTSSNGHTMTHWAAKRIDDIRFIQYLYEQIPFYNTTNNSTTGSTHYPTIFHRPSLDSTGMTPIHWVCTMPTSTSSNGSTTLNTGSSLPLLHYMIQKSISSSSLSSISNNIYDIRDSSGCTPLLIASQHGHVDLVAYLCQQTQKSQSCQSSHSVNIYATDNNYDTALHWASYKGSQQVLGLLCYYDTSSTSTTTNGSDTTTSTNTSSSSSVTSMLLQPDIYGQTPLHLASLRGHTTCVRYILQQLQQRSIATCTNNTTSIGNRNRSRTNNTTSTYNSKLFMLFSSLCGCSNSSSMKSNNNTNNYHLVKEILYYKDKNGRTPYELAIHKDKPTVATVLKQHQDLIDTYYSNNNGTNGNNANWMLLNYIKIIKTKCTIQLIQSLFKLQTWKHWLGLQDNYNNKDEYDEQSKLPYYYVCTLFIIHFIYHYTIFIPLLNFQWIFYILFYFFHTSTSTTRNNSTNNVRGSIDDSYNSTVVAHTSSFSNGVNYSTSSNVDDGVLWDYVGFDMVCVSFLLITYIFLHLTTTTNPGTMISNEKNTSQNNTTTLTSVSKTTTTLNTNTDDDSVNINYWKTKYVEILQQMATNVNYNCTPIDTTSTSTNTNTNTTAKQQQVQHQQQLEYTLCHTCHVARPYRSKHCKQQRSCVVVFDHYCPFVNSTIGLYNYRYFYSFLLFMNLYFILFWILLIKYILRCHSSTSNTIDNILTHNVDDIQHYHYRHQGLLSFIVFSFTNMFGILLGIHIIFPFIMIIYHTQLICINLTTNEHMQLKKYDYFWINSNNNNNSNTTQKLFYNPWNNGIIQNFVNRLLFPNENSYMLTHTSTTTNYNNNNINNNTNGTLKKSFFTQSSFNEEYQGLLSSSTLSTTDSASSTEMTIITNNNANNISKKSLPTSSSNTGSTIRKLEQFV